jgi:hypothetical protein
MGKVDIGGLWPEVREGAGAGRREPVGEPDGGGIKRERLFSGEAYIFAGATADQPAGRAN